MVVEDVYQYRMVVVVELVYYHMMMVEVLVVVSSIYSIGSICCVGRLRCVCTCLGV